MIIDLTIFSVVHTYNITYNILIEMLLAICYSIVHTYYLYLIIYAVSPMGTRAKIFLTLI